MAFTSEVVLSTGRRIDLTDALITYNKDSVGFYKKLPFGHLHYAKGTAMKYTSFTELRMRRTKKQLRLGWRQSSCTSVILTNSPFLWPVLLFSHRNHSTERLFNLIIKSQKSTLQQLLLSFGIASVVISDWKILTPLALSIFLIWWSTVCAAVRWNRLTVGNRV